MRTNSQAERIALGQRNIAPARKATNAGVFIGKKCVYEGSFALCNQFKALYEPKATVRGIYG